MRWEFPYVRLRGRYFPIVPVGLVTDRRVDTVAILDSGASISVFKPSVAHELGIDVEGGDLLLVEGISGKISLYVHPVEMELEGHGFSSRVAFSPEYTASVNLLGREGFFDQFLITFDEESRKVFLETFS